MPVRIPGQAQGAGPCSIRRQFSIHEVPPFRMDITDRARPPACRDRLFVLDEAVLDQPQVLVPDEPDPRSVILVLCYKQLDGRAVLYLHASGERPRRSLARLIETD